MKRSPLIRRTPLVSRKGLTSHTELRRGTSELRRTPLAPISRKRLVLNRERAVAVSALQLLSNGICPRCGASDRILHGHERLARAHSSTSFLRPDVLICDPCNEALENEPLVSAWCGWKISAKHPHDPALAPTQARALNGSIVEFASVAADEAVT